jgi:excinuclease ABC subunit C
MAEWLSEKRGRGTTVVLPKRGEARALLGTATRNAESSFQSARLALDRPEATLPLIAEKLRLRNPPQRIECFDISNIGGKYAVGSMVTFTAGVSSKEGYRRFRIRTVPGADDYAMMYEVLKRRYEKRENLPDLVMVDGGKGQLGVALAALKDCGVAGVDVIGLAKGRDERRSDANRPSPAVLTSAGGVQIESGGGTTVYRLSADAGARGKDGAPSGRDRRIETPGKGEDRVYLPGRKDPVYLTRWPAALFLLQRIRDEAHSFAVAFHRKVKEKEDLKSLLDRIPSIGEKRRKALLVFFGDVKRIRAASIQELQQVAGIGGRTARRICTFLAGESPAVTCVTDGRSESKRETSL